MSTQWHPLFAHLLRLQIEAFYRVDTEVPTSELPRKADILVVRRADGPEPPFLGLWTVFGTWLAALHPNLWKEIRHVATVPDDGPVLHLDALIDMVGAGPIIEMLGVECVIRELGVQRIIEVIGLDTVIQTVGREKLLKHLFPRRTPEQIQELLREPPDNGSSTAAE